MLTRPVMFDNAQMRALLPGDVVVGGEQISALTTAGAGTLTAALLIAGIIRRTGPAGVFNDTTDSAQNIINAIISAYFVGTGAVSPAGVPIGTTWRLRYSNTVAFAGTVVAGAGVTLGVNTATINASSVKDFLLTVLNGTPTQVYAATTTNASAVITGLTQAQTQNLSVGMVVSGTGIQAASTILSVQPGIGVTLSLNATATATLVALTFSPSVQIDGLGQGLL